MEFPISRGQGDQLTMWQVINSTPFAVDRSWVRDLNGAEVWLVAVRCTFRVHPNGKTTVAEDQDPVVLAPRHFGDPSTSSLQYDTDFVLTKPTTDVILHGSAYAPAGRPATSVNVSMRVGEVRKTLRVTGDRPYRKKLLRVTPGNAQSFTTLPLTYERAYGGGELVAKKQDRPRFFDWNPVGTGYFPAVGKGAPNVKYSGLRGRKRTAGFGPIPPHWKPRVKYAGTYDDAWLKNRHPLYPNDLDDRFFLCSPADQQPACFLRGGEPVILTNLTPGGRLAFSLPRVAFGFETMFFNSEPVQHWGKLHTVILEPDAERVVLVWRTSLPCHPKVQSLLFTRVWQKQITSFGSGRDAWKEEDKSQS